MKKAGLLFLSLLFLACVSSCKGKRDNAFESYASGVSIQADYENSSLEYSEIMIDVKFTRVEYVPVLRTIRVAFTVHDNGWRNAKYFLALMIRDSIYPTKITLFNGSGSDFSFSGSFEISDDGYQYGITVGKIDLDLPLSDTYDGSAWVEWEDPEFSDRYYLSDTRRSDTTIETTDRYEDSFATFSFSMQESGPAISNFRIMIREPGSGAVVDTLIVQANSVRTGEGLAVDGRFDGLAPNLEYTVDVYGDGNDGVDSFSDVLLLSIPVHSAVSVTIPDVLMGSSYHGLYALIHREEYSGENLTLSYYYRNDGAVNYADTDETVTLQMICRDPDGRIIATYEINEGDHDLVIPYSEIGPGYFFQIVDQRGEDTFQQLQVDTFDPDPQVRQIAGNRYQIWFTGDSSNLIRIDVEVYVEGFPQYVERWENVNFQGVNSFSIYHDFSGLTEFMVTHNWYMEIIYTYEAMGRQITKRDTAF